MKKVLKIILIIIIAVALIAAAINIYVVMNQKDNILMNVEGEAGLALSGAGGRIAMEQAANCNTDCILVLGAAVKPDGTPSKMLRDRLEVAVYLYKKGVAPKMLLSGDNGSVYYNEVKAMKNYVLAAGVPAKNVFLDYAGFSTYETMYRARRVFDVDSMVIVTQGYHEYRALYDAQHLGMNAVAIAADQKTYSGQTMRSLREIAARDKDFLMCIIKPKPQYLGSEIPISGKGNAFKDK